MKSKTALLFSIFLFVSLFSIYSQPIYEFYLPRNKANDGYIVTNSNDTLYGSIRLPGGVLNQEEIFFTDSNGVEKMMLPMGLKSVSFGKYLLTKDTTYEKRPILLHTLNDGYLKIYIYYWAHIKVAHGPLVIAYKKNEKRFLVQQGNQRIEKLPYFEHLCYFTEDNPEIAKTIFKQQNNPMQFIIDDVNEYNIWLIKSGKLNNRKLKDSTYGSTKLSFFDAENSGLLKYCPSDSTMVNYYFRIKNYGPNTPEFKEYLMYRNLKYKDIPVKEGMRVKISNHWIKIGTWRYYYPSKSKKDMHIKKEEYYNASGKLSGSVNYYDLEGNIIKTEAYYEGKKVVK